MKFALWLAPLLLVLLFPAVARAEEPEYGLEVDSDAPAIGFDQLAPRLSADLGRPIGRGQARVSIVVRYRSATRELVVRADHGDGRVLERAVTVKEGEEASTATLLAQNLARDEARELLDGFAARQPAPPVELPPPAPPAPPSAERPERRVHASAGVAYPLATTMGSPNAHTNLDFSLLYARAGTVDGLQLSSFGGAYASRELNGVQLTMVGAYARHVRGAQIAVGFNLAHDLRGVQIASGLGYADEMHGVQLAPLNVAEHVAGVQIGAINVARNVKGVQVGVVNLAEKVDGTALGLVSVSKNSVHPVAFGSNLAFTNAGVKFLTGPVYTLAAVTYGTLENDFDQLAMTGALGGHIPLDALVANLDLEPEANIIGVFPRKGNDIDNNLWLGGRASVGYSFAKHLRVFAGGGARFPLIVNQGREVTRPEILAGVQF